MTMNTFGSFISKPILPSRHQDRDTRKLAALIVKRREKVLRKLEKH